MDRENIAPIPQAGMTEENTKKKKVKEVLEYAESLTVVFAVMLLIFTFIARPATVDGESMLPTLCNGERLVISNLFYEPAPGDIVVLCGEADREEGRNLIKRIIAVGGQTIDIDFETGEVTVDGEVLDEPYILERTGRGHRVPADRAGGRSLCHGRQPQRFPRQPLFERGHRQGRIYRRPGAVPLFPV